MIFVDGVARILRLEGVIQGDDDAPSGADGFSSTQHAAMVQRAVLAVQSEITHLVAEEMLEYEWSSDTITTVAGTRTYNLASDFVNFDAKPRLVKEDGSGNATTTMLTPYGGGEVQLRIDFPQYREQTGEPTHFYDGTGATKNVALYMVPDTTGDVYRYYYQASVRVTTETDTLPFANEEEAETFIECAARRFKYLNTSVAIRDQLFPAGIERDPVLLDTRGVLMKLMNGIKKPQKYGRAYPNFPPRDRDGW